MNITKLENEVDLSRDVRKLKKSFLDEFFRDKEKLLFEHMKNLPLGSVDDLVEIHHQLKSLNALQVEIQSVIDTGKMAQMELDKEDQ